LEDLVGWARGIGHPNNTWTPSSQCASRAAVLGRGQERAARDGQPGLAVFAAAYRPKRQLLVGGDGIALEEFLSRLVEDWI